MEKFVCLTTQLYTVPSGRDGNFFISTPAAELDDILVWKWNTERVVMFQTGILQ